MPPAAAVADGVINEIEALRAQTAGIEVIMDHCIYRDFLSCGVRKPLGWTGTC